MVAEVHHETVSPQAPPAAVAAVAHLPAGPETPYSGSSATVRILVVVGATKSAGAAAFGPEARLVQLRSLALPFLRRRRRRCQPQLVVVQRVEERRRANGQRHTAATHLG